MKKEEFDLEYQWKLYLERVAVKEEELPPIQVQETKRAFYGACGQLMMLFKNTLTNFDDDTAVDLLQDMEKQILTFWQNEVEKDKNDLSTN